MWHSKNIESVFSVGGASVGKSVCRIHLSSILVNVFACETFNSYLSHLCSLQLFRCKSSIVHTEKYILNFLGLNFCILGLIPNVWNWKVQIQILTICVFNNKRVPFMGLLQEHARSSSGNSGRGLQQAHSWGPVGRVCAHHSLWHQVCVDVWSVLKTHWKSVSCQVRLC